ncbi:hypothetical protein [Phyllobacterium sp. SB3]|uniref:hypothetical protein n=1 Tax=Phyllobacterium sp. SB3 TaxID=3156073 RepID=UPI0032AF8E30
MNLEFDESMKFWVTTERWPQDSSEYVFLARAVHQIGRHRFPGEWLGSEVTASNLLGNPQSQKPLPPSPGAATDGQKIRAYLILNRNNPDRGPLPLTSKLSFSDAEWELALKTAAEIDRKQKTAISRFSQTVDIVIKALVDGQLISVLRPGGGGAFSSPLDKSFWNSENLRQRFQACMMNRSDPFGHGFAGKGYEYIFIEKESLDSFARTPPPVSRRFDHLRKTEEPKDLIRKDILKQLERGDITVQVAKQQAEYREAVLEIIPDKSDFDPMKKRVWSLPMVVAWIIWRDVEKVREHFDDYRLQRHDNWTFKSTVLSGAVLQSQGKSSLPLIEKSYKNRPGSDNLFERAVDELLTKLIQGELVAMALENGEPAQITSAQWSHLHLAGSSAGGDILHSPGKSAKFTDMTILRTTVLDQWPLNKTAAEKPCWKDQLSPAQKSISDAVDQLWGNDKPFPPSVGERNVAIVKWLRDNNRTLRSDKTITRYFDERKRHSSD